MVYSPGSDSTIVYHSDDSVDDFSALSTATNDNTVAYNNLPNPNGLVTKLEYVSYEYFFAPLAKNEINDTINSHIMPVPLLVRNEESNKVSAPNLEGHNTNTIAVETHIMPVHILSRERQLSISDYLFAATAVVENTEEHAHTVPMKDSEMGLGVKRGATIDVPHAAKERGEPHHETSHSIVFRTKRSFSRKPINIKRTVATGRTNG